jgi:glycosyltransferase involved in cell wall biosynthesis
MTMMPSNQVHVRQGTAQDAPVSARRISIALCTYNGARFLEAQLESFLAQSRLPDEVVACDDGSTDDTLAVLERFAKRAVFPVRIERNESRLGSTKNFEKAISLCTGELIATSDQDDVWLPEKLALSEAAFANDPSLGLFFTNAEVVDADLHTVGYSMWDAIDFGPLAQRQVRAGRAFKVLLRQWLVTGATMTFRAEFCPFILPIPADWIHDGWIAVIIGGMAKVGLLDRSTVKYRQHPSQQIGGKKLNWRELYALAREVGPPYFHLSYERFVLAQERLHAFATRIRDPRFLAMIDRKVVHQKRRLAIAESQSRKERVFWALREFLRGGYWRYSPNCKHFIKDVIF